MIEMAEITNEDIVHVATHIRADDERELLTVTSASEHPLDVQSCLEWSVAASEGDCLAIHPFLDGKPGPAVALFGVVDDGERSPGMGVVWMVCTDMLLTTSRDIMRVAPGIFKDWFVRYPNGLHNRIDTRNDQHMRWIKKFGADIPGSGVYIRNVPFAYFIISPKGVAA